MRILCVHQGYELYGSDRCFISSVAAIRRLFPDAEIETVIPLNGPILSELTPHSTRVRIDPSLWVLRRKYLSRMIARGWFTLPLAVSKALTDLRRSDFVYLNTITLVDYLIAARFCSKKVVLHVHELPKGLAGYLFRRLIRYARVPTIYNSKATHDWFAANDGPPSYVLHNGYLGPLSCELSDYAAQRPLRVLLIGRINSWKGQDLLIEACNKLSNDIQRRIDVRIVGSTFEGNSALERHLHELVGAGPCRGCVTFEPFSEDPSVWYRWSDIVVVPSRQPEPFGRVPVEAMSFGRGAIVARFGGLVESVEDGATGWHVTPNDPVDLARALERAVLEPEWIAEFGRNARMRYEAKFRQDIIDRQFDDIITRHASWRDAAPWS